MTRSTGHSLAIAMIVRDESEVISRCLNSARTVTDNILVLDTGSTDDTVRLAEEAGAKVRHFTWVNDFSAARNKSFELADKEFSPEYIMWLDADDVIEPDDAIKIRKLLESADADVYFAPYAYAQDANGNPSLLLIRERILKASLNLRWEGLIHEAIGVLGADLKTVNCEDWKITHKRPVDRAPGARNINIYRLWIKQNGKLPTSRDTYYYARTLQETGNITEAKSVYAEFVAAADAWWEDKATAYYNMARIARAQGLLEEAQRYASQAAAIKHTYAEAYCLLGEACMADKQWVAAIHWYQIATNCERPADTLGATQREYYTWLPWLQLAVCYTKLGKLPEAREANAKAAKLHPSHPSIRHNFKLLNRQDGKGKRLNLGCGGKRMEGYVNCDLFSSPAVDEAFSLDSIPYADGTISAIHSEHALEHLPRAKAELAPLEWARVLKPGGELLLKIPDIELCCEYFLKSKEDHLKEWYHHTIFGYQASLRPGDEPDEAQIHRCGFTKERIKTILENAGFVIDHITNYDGWSTPSIEIRALRKRDAKRIGWLANQLWDDAGNRIRALQVDRWLRALGFDSKVIDINTLNSSPQAFDAVVAGRSISSDLAQSLSEYKAQGGKVIIDINDDHFALNTPSLGDMLNVADVVVTCSKALGEKAENWDKQHEVGFQVITIEDGIETASDLNCQYTEKDNLSAVWLGYGGNAEPAEALRPLLAECGYDLTTIHERDSANIKWNRETWPQEMVRHDIAICPERDVQLCKSANKLTTAAALGLPVVASPLPAYIEVARHGESAFLAKTQEEWKAAFMALKGRFLREKIGQTGRRAVERYRSHGIVSKWSSVFSGLLGTADTINSPTDIIIPTFNNPDLLKGCLESLVLNTDQPFTVTVVDVGTKCADHDEMRNIVVKIGSKCLGYNLIKPEKRTSFSQSNNLAIKATFSPYVCLLNDDTLVTPGWLRSMRDAIDCEGFDLCGPWSNCDQGWLHNEQINIDGVDLRPGMHPEQIAHIIDSIYEYGRKRSLRNLPTRELPWTAAYAWLMKRSLLDAVGLLDETFLNGGEDADFCYRAAKLGFRIGYCERAFVFHYGGKSRKVSEDQDLDRHHQEDQFNNAWLQEKYAKSLAVLYTGPAYETWSANSIVKGGIGGSETAVIQMSRELTNLGYRVVVFADKPADFSGEVLDAGCIKWKHFSEFPAFVDANYIDIFVASRMVDSFTLPIRSGKNLVWVHDLWLSPHAQLPECERKVDNYLCLSPWHKKFFTQHHRIDPARVLVTRNGIDLTRFLGAESAKRDPYRFIYSSSPDRGLEALLDMWPEIRSIQPDANLRIFYGFDNWLKNANDQDKVSIERIMTKLDQPGILAPGRIDQGQLAQEMLSATFFAYPTWFWETSCISAMEAQAAGLCIITSKVAALETTVGENGIMIDAGSTEWDAFTAVNSHEYKQNYLTVIARLLSSPNEVAGWRQKGITASAKYTWKSVAEDWDTIFKSK